MFLLHSVRGGRGRFMRSELLLQGIDLFASLGTGLLELSKLENSRAICLLCSVRGGCDRLMRGELSLQGLDLHH